MKLRSSFVMRIQQRPASNGPSRSASSTPTSRSRSTCSSAPESWIRTLSARLSSQTDYQSMVGPVAWKGGGPNNPVKNASVNAARRRTMEEGRKVQIRPATLPSTDWLPIFRWIVRSKRSNIHDARQGIYRRPDRRPAPGRQSLHAGRIRDFYNKDGADSCQAIGLKGPLLLPSF